MSSLQNCQRWICWKVKKSKYNVLPKTGIRGGGSCNQSYWEVGLIAILKHLFPLLEHRSFKQQSVLGWVTALWVCSIYFFTCGDSKNHSWFFPSPLVNTRILVKTMVFTLLPLHSNETLFSRVGTDKITRDEGHEWFLESPQVKIMFLLSWNQHSNIITVHS
jgi:hypothetical protein